MVPQIFYRFYFNDAMMSPNPIFHENVFELHILIHHKGKFDINE
jgi:hypothetical protein